VSRLRDAITRFIQPKRPEFELPTPEEVEEVEATFKDHMAAALEKYPPREKVANLRALTGHDSPCPRCGSNATTINFMSGAHEGCPDDRMATVRDPFGMVGWGVNYGLLALNQRIMEASIPHQDRGCHNCGYGWVEGAL
jgi:hypothetical protein